jgi:hypothetical protein
MATLDPAINLTAESVYQTNSVEFIIEDYSKHLRLVHGRIAL